MVVGGGWTFTYSKNKENSATIKVGCQSQNLTSPKILSLLQLKSIMNVLKESSCQGLLTFATGWLYIISYFQKAFCCGSE
jgi:hypothetical protein